MADFTPTRAQGLAIENRGGALLVSAAAGSGKTRVLTERLMSYITDPEHPADIDAFLVITYTRAAAAELRSRITDEIADRIAADPSARRLRRQNALVQRAQIGTIHSFCTTLLRENCHLAGLLPDFAVADEDRAGALRALALEKVMEAAYEDPDPDFRALADSVGAGRDDGRLADLVLALHGRMQCHARPEAWAQAQIEALSGIADDAGKTIWGRELLGAAKADTAYWAEEFDRLLALMSQDNFAYIMKAYGGSIGETAAALRAFSRAADTGWDCARGCLPVPFPRLGSLRNPPDADTVAFIRARRDACKEAMKKLAAGFAEPSEKLLRDLARTAPAMGALLRLVLRFNDRFAAEKRRRSLVDFSDLEHLTVRLLTDESGAPTAKAREISGRFTEVMVDEYQDVSEVQDRIIRAVSRDGANRFMVGDVKQSVYRFRLADPTIFINKYLTYRDAADAEPGEPRRILLQENFRSRAQVLNAVNTVFSNIMSTELGELDYDENAALKPGAVYRGDAPTPELVCIGLPETADDDERPDKTALEAAAVARRIRRLISDRATVTDHGAERPVGFGDIAVLLRSVKVTGGIYRREFARAGIPVLSDQSGGFFRSSEVSVLLSLLAVIDNPRQDVPLISVLRSPLFGFTAEELAAVRVCDRLGDFFSALTAAAEKDEKCAAFLETLAGFRRFAPDAELGALIREIYGRLGCMAVAAAAPDGAARRKNLTLLFELAQKFEQNGYRGLHRFIGWLRAMEARGEEPRTGSECSGGAVRIMSVHKSKGLEFPVVFLCDTARQFNKTDTRGSVLVHPLLGLGPKLTDADRGIEYPTLAWRAVASRMLRETLSEEMRLLYVAMTRARERLYITCSLADPAQTIDKISRSVTSPVAPQALSAMASPAQWLVAAALADGQAHLRLTVEPGGAAVQPEAAASSAAAAQRTEEIIDLSPRLDWTYPHSAAVRLPSKITATELKSLGAEDPESADLLPLKKRLFRRPDLAGAGRRLGAAEKGTAAHLALRYVDFAKTGSLPEIAGEIARLRETGLLSEAEAAAVDPGALFRLFSSPLGARMRAARAPMREFPFTLLCPAHALFPDGGDDEMLLQGVVDCCIEEDGVLIVIDYKTDRVAADGVAARAAAYETQLRTYAYALRRITGKPVGECILYFLNPGAAFSVSPAPEK